VTVSTETNGAEPTPRAAAQPAQPRRNHVATISLIVAAAGAVGCHLLARSTPLAGAGWLPIITAGFDAALVGGLADWFAVTALFRHPLGIPIPHTAILAKRRGRIVEGIAAMVEKEWLSPAVIGARLARFEPSAFVIEWLRDGEHARRLAAPLRDVLCRLAQALTDPEWVTFVEHTLTRQLRLLPIDGAGGRWLLRFLDSERADPAFVALAQSLANLAERPDTADNLREWLQRAASTLRQEGKILVPLFLRSRVIQRKLVEAACGYASSELRKAAGEPDHPARLVLSRAARAFAERLAAGDAATLTQVEQIRHALIDSLEAQPLVRGALTQLRAQIEHDLTAPEGALARLVERQLHSGIVEALEPPERRAAFDHWVRATVDDLARRHHHQVGLTVRENLDALDTRTLITQIEERIGPDLQYIRLNGALVGGLIGVVLAVAHRLLG